MEYRSTVGEVRTQSHNTMVYCTLKPFLADGGCSSSHPSTALKGQKGLSYSIQTALSTAFHPCDHALWWLHHTDCGLWGIDSSTPNLVGWTSYLTDHAACDIVCYWCACFSCSHWFSIASGRLSPLSDMKVTVKIRNPTFEKHGINGTRGKQQETHVNHANVNIRPI